MTAKRSRGCVSPLKQAFCEGRWSGYGESDGRFTSRWKRERSPAGPAGLGGHLRGVRRGGGERLRRKRRPLYLAMEAGALTRWASGIVRPLVERLIICEPRHNRLINSNPTKSDEADVEGMCLLLRLGKLKEVWMGTDRTREIYRALVYELLSWRDAQRELKALIKARYRGWGVLRLHGIRVFSAKGRQEYLAQVP